MSNKSSFLYQRKDPLWISGLPALHLSVTPSLKTGTSPPSCQLLDNCLYIPVHGAAEIVKTTSCVSHSGSPILSIVYLNQHFGAAHSKSWSKYAFSSITRQIYNLKIPEKVLKWTKRVENGWKKYFNQYSGVRSTWKLVEIYNISGWKKQEWFNIWVISCLNNKSGFHLSF